MLFHRTFVKLPRSCRQIKTMAEQPSSFFTRTGSVLTKFQFLDSIAKDACTGEDGPPCVVLLGENHSDPEAHAIELDVFKRLHQSRPEGLSLSLEFYDREAQAVMDEFTSGLVTRDVFLRDARAPSNAVDYQPMLDYCKEKGLNAIAANCPRRYSRMVSQGGRRALEDCLTKYPASARLLAPMPYQGASEMYLDKFVSIMREMGNDNPDVAVKMADAQALWDATMAHSISEALPSSQLILHVAGHFHVAHGLGIAEHLEHYCPEVKRVSAVVLPEENPEEFVADRHAEMADYIVLTDMERLE